MAQPGRNFQAFAEFDGEILKHRRVVRLKFTPPLDWRATLIRFHGAGRVEWKR
jgi:hypothetical protein